MRFPNRVVGDYHVDRPQVQRQQCQSRAVLIARKLQIRIVKETRQKAREFLSQQHTPSGGDKGGRDIMVAIAAGIHLFPFRTEKLSPRAPMILLYQVGKWVAANLKRKALQSAMTAGLFCFPAEPENKQCITSAPHCLVVHAAAAAELHAPFGRGPAALLSLLDRNYYFNRSGRSILVRARACSSFHWAILS